MMNVGDRVPSIEYASFGSGSKTELKTDDLFKDKLVVLFGLPGAFTPTCSSYHLPEYEKYYSSFRTLGVDSIICCSVNDDFVMRAWAKDLGIKNVTMLPDGTGKFTQGLGMTVDHESLSFGFRSWRYSMLVNDGIIQKSFVEPKTPGDPFTESNATNMLEYLKGNSPLKDHYLIFTNEDQNIIEIENSLKNKNKPYKVISIKERTANLEANEMVHSSLSVLLNYPFVLKNGKFVNISQL